MKTLKKLSAFASIRQKQKPLKIRKNQTYKPSTRLQKIKEKRMIYPQCSQNRFIFISTLDGAGFQKQTYLNCPFDIPIDKMVNRINVSCYKQWEVNRMHNERNPFERLDFLSNLAIIMFLIFGFILYLLNINKSSFISSFLYVFLVFIVTSMLVSLITFCQKVEEYDTDKEMISSIKKQLEELNNQEKQRSQGHPNFAWSCHKECLWICLKALNVSTQDQDIMDS